MLLAGLADHEDTMRLWMIVLVPVMRRAWSLFADVKPCCPRSFSQTHGLELCKPSESRLGDLGLWALRFRMLGLRAKDFMSRLVMFIVDSKP